ncbi:NAD(FAD)-dependent dehydrogenase [Burkholderiales bacterium JOSHI_001]|nr:NAD(FAD)-dependent dehydrogenase [Burkholderiales bacterium JOSHI_001]
MSTEPIVIVGGGHAAAQLCASLAEAGLGPRVHLVCEEPLLPYQRPPLSKAYLKNPDEPLQTLKAEAWLREQGITLHVGQRATAIDRAARTVTLADGHVLPYARLVLATGTRARLLPGVGSDLANVAALRTAADAQRLRGLLAAASSVTVLGGGFIGLELAATARAQGKAVTVLETAPRLLGRSVSAELAAHVLATHQAAGTQVRLGVTVGDFQVAGGRLASLSVDGQPQPVDLLVLGIGAVPETTLAQAAGLDCDNGVRVDACLRSSDPQILAMGDCSNFTAQPQAGEPGARLRLESVQNANDQARTAAATLQEREEPYAALPWFWSEQGAMRLQMVGLLPAGATSRRRPGANPQSFSLLHFVGERLACVESVNAAADHLAARKLIERGCSLAPSVLCDPAVALKAHL